MRDIEGIEKAVDIIRPHWDAIDKHFERENQQFKALLAQDHDLIGRVLKCHLIVEHYLTRFLQEQLRVDNLTEVKLTFHQKAMLLPDKKTSAAFVKPGIVRLNRIRNQFGHSLAPELSIESLGPINETISIFRKDVDLSQPISRIEAFTTIAVTFLIVTPPKLQKLFMEAFANVEVHAF